MYALVIIVAAVVIKTEVPSDQGMSSSMTTLVNVDIVTLVQRVKGRRFCPFSQRITNEHGRVSDVFLKFPGSQARGRQF
jgi:hypothetical protein